MFFSGEDSGNEREAEGEENDEENGQCGMSLEGEGDNVFKRETDEEVKEAEESTDAPETSGQTKLEPEKPQKEQVEVKEFDEVKSDEEEGDTNISFPDTTISLRHLQSNR